MSNIDRTNIDAMLPSIICCLGSKGYQAVRTQDKGCSPCDERLPYLIRLSKILSSWYSEGYVIQEARTAAWVADVTILDPGDNIPFPDAYNIDIPDGIGGTSQLFAGMANNITAIVTYINAHTSTNGGFSAKIIPHGGSTKFWLYGPYNYNGIIPTGNFVDIVNGLNRIYTVYGFQRGCPEIVAEEPCLNNQQVENMLEIFKKECSLCVSTITNSLTT